MTHKEFVNWGMEVMLDSMFRGGLSEMRKTFEYTVMQHLHVIYTRDGGFTKESK